MIFLILSILYIYLCFASGDYLMGTVWSIITAAGLTISIYYTNKKDKKKPKKI